MFLGKVVGTVWSTKKVDNLRNLRLLLIHPGQPECEDERGPGGGGRCGRGRGWANW
jgi:microcompartment protein CcmK/EutM